MNAKGKKKRTLIDQNRGCQGTSPEIVRFNGRTSDPIVVLGDPKSWRCTRCVSL